MLRSDFPNGANREFKNFTVSYVAVSMVEIIGRIVSSLSPFPFCSLCNFAVVYNKPGLEPVGYILLY